MKYNNKEAWADLKYYYRNINGRPIEYVKIDRDLKKLGIINKGKAYPVENIEIKGWRVHAEKGNIGGFEITASDIHNDSMKLDESGLTLKNDNVDVGRIGTKAFLTSSGTQSSYKLLDTSLEADGAAIIWGRRDSTDEEGVYTTVFVYANADYSDYEQGNFYMHGNLNLCGHTLKNFDVKDGLSQTVQLLLPGAINDDGTINKSYVKTVNIQNGIVLSN